MAAVHEVTLTLREGLFTSSSVPTGRGRPPSSIFCPAICFRTGGRFYSRETRSPGWGRIRGENGISRSFQVMNIFPG